MSPVMRSTRSIPKLPLSVRRRGGFPGKAVIHPESAPDHEQAVGIVVCGADRELL